MKEVTTMTAKLILHDLQWFDLILANGLIMNFDSEAVIAVAL